MPPKSKALALTSSESTVTKASSQLGTSGAIGSGRPYGGTIAKGTGAAALGGATVAMDNNSVTTTSTPEWGVPTGTNMSGSAESAFQASMQHLEAPLNAAITQWINDYSPNIGALLKVTGLQPTQLIDGLVKRFHRWGVQPTPANVHAAALDVVDSAEERAAIRTDDQLMTDNIDSQSTILTRNDEKFRRTIAAISVIKQASKVFPGQIHDLIAVREALQMKPEVFVAAVELGWGFNPEVYLGDQVQDDSERLYIR